MLMLIMLAPLAYLPMARGASLDSRAFDHRWTGASDANGGASTHPGSAPGNSLTGTNRAVEASLIDLTYNPERFINQKIAVVGMLHRDPKLAQRFGTNTCVVFRFVVTCCAADAQPVAALVIGGVPDHWADDTWVRVEGRFAQRDDKGQAVPTVELDKATRVPEPSPPYLY